MMNHLDLFSGIGGFALGLQRADFNTVAFCEIEPYAQRVLAKHWPDVPIYEDIRNVTKEKLESDGIDRIDIITGGFPCQDLSFAGNQGGIEAERSGLWSELSRIIGDIQPRYAIIENVSALLMGDGGSWFRRVLTDLARIGYDAEWHCIPAFTVGAPQRRNRVWIIAYPQSHTSKKPELVGQILANTEIYGESGRMGWPEWPRWDADQCPLVGVAYGVSDRLDRDWKHRFRGLGNAVVPQIVEVLGRAIMEAEHAGTQ